MDSKYNGATISANGSGGCWCEIGMTQSNGQPGYQTCKFDENSNANPNLFF
jgi:hypothetical protein